MSNPNALEALPSREQLSALADGELDASAVAAACADWQRDAELRAAWHSYQLIGDVLRSDDLATSAPHDSPFMASLRSRLAAEPVVLAPAPIIATAVNAAPRRARRWAWAAPSAVAAGFVAVAGAVFVTRAPAPGPQLAVAPVAPSVASPATLPPAVSVVVRDPQLDRYLAAHKQFAGSSALGMPAGYLRNAAVEAPSR